MHRRPEYLRSFPLEDIEIERGGDGRTVTAYAATFGTPYEVTDVHGHYFETINRAAFNRTVSHGVTRVSVFYNHARTVSGTPSDQFSIPLGAPLEITPDTRGLLTRTRYNKTPLADNILEAIRSGSIRAQSFRGPIFRSAHPSKHDSGLPLIERTELGLIEYGPTPLAVNADAEIVGVRSDLLTVDPAELTDEERAELLALLQTGTRSDPGNGSSDGSPDDSTGTPPGDEPPTGPSVDTLRLAQAQRRRRA